MVLNNCVKGNQYPITLFTDDIPDKELLLTYNFFLLVKSNGPNKTLKVISLEDKVKLSLNVIPGSIFPQCQLSKEYFSYKNLHKAATEYILKHNNIF